jgi:hypothetical protein
MVDLHASALLWERKRRKYRGTDGDTQSQLEGFCAFAEDHVWIKHPQGRRKLQLRPEQVEIARAMICDDKVIALKARQIGFTTVTMVFVLWRCLFFDDWDVIILNRREEDAKYNLRMLSLAFDSLPQDLKDNLPDRLDNNASRVSFSNGSVVESHPSSNNPARGRTARQMVLDEWAFMPNPDDAWASVEPATDIGGQIVVLSTANGWGNLFHSTWVSATKGDNGFVHLFFPWSAVPERDDEWYATKKRTMPSWQLAQEYPSNPEEAFIQSGNPYFDLDVIRKLEMMPPTVGRLHSPYGGSKGFTFAQDSTGPLKVWQLPRAGTHYVVGADVAQGLLHGDYSSAHVVDGKTGELVAHWHGHIDPDEFGLELSRLGHFYMSALVGVEVNNHGLTTCKALQRTSYPRIYWRRRHSARNEKATDEIGWLTTSTTKPLMLDELSAALRDGSLLVRDEATRQELMTYVRGDNGRTFGSPHDDRVMSLGITVQMMKYAFSSDLGVPQFIPEFSIANGMRLIRETERAAARSKPIGHWNVRGR